VQVPLVRLVFLAYQEQSVYQDLEERMVNPEPRVSKVLQASVEIGDPQACKVSLDSPVLLDPRDHRALLDSKDHKEALERLDL